jgi:ABC transporter related protein
MQTHQPSSNLQVVKVNKTIHKKKIIKDVSISLNSGQIVGLLGPNGAGKTSLFYTIIGLVSADTGNIYLNDIDIIHMPIHKRFQLGLGYLPQEASIFRNLSVEDNLLAILQLHYPKSEQQHRLYQLLTELDIMHIKNHLGLSISGGERRRVEIARVLASNPQFILLDEPFSGVDPLSIADIQSIILLLKKKSIGILITDHHVRETLKICDYTYIINEGQVLAEGHADQLIRNDAVKRVYLGQEFSL